MLVAELYMYTSVVVIEHMMYFVPVRKLVKILFVRGVSTKRERTPLTLHETLDNGSDSRRRCFRKWLFFIVTILLCLYYVFYHILAQNMIVIRHNEYSIITGVTLNRNKEENKGHMVTKSSPNMDAKIIIHNNTEENMKENNLATITTDNTSVVFYQERNISKHIVDVMLTSTEKNKRDERLFLTVTNDDLPSCGAIEEHKDKEEESKMKKLLSDNLFPEVNMGGYYQPKNCRSRHKVAILVPYRNRERNLAVFMYHMHPFLIRQQLEYRIFVIEQAGEKLFNRGKLFNIGFMEMMKFNDWHCVVLHDVDLLPQSDKILYTCPTFPRHMCGTVVEKAKLTYNQYHTLFGGVSALTVQHYKQINGFSNLFWGWGGEDNDMYWRLLSSRIPIVRYNKTIAQYKSLPHSQQPKNKHRYQLLHFTAERCKTDGLSSLVYKVIWTKYRHLYTHILADVNPWKENITDVFSKLFG